jgi:hypothetical protein
MPSNADWFARKGLFAVSGPGVSNAYKTIGALAVYEICTMRWITNCTYAPLSGVQFVYLDRYLAAFRRHQDQKTSTNDRMTLKCDLDAELRENGLSYRSQVHSHTISSDNVSMGTISRSGYYMRARESIGLGQV